MVPMFKVDKQILVTTEAYNFRQIRTNFIQHPASGVNSLCRRNYWGSSMWIDATGQLLIIKSTFVKYVRKKMGI
jgi:hypothetical protein